MAPTLVFCLLDLPMELHDLVLSHLEPEALISYTLAAYPHLASRRQHAGDFPPVLTRASLQRASCPATSGGLQSSLASQPSEMLLLFMSYLSQRDVVALALGEYRTFTSKGIAPWPLGREVIYGLRAAVLRGG